MDIRFSRPLGIGALALGLLGFVSASQASAQDTLLEVEILYEIDGDSQGDLLGASVDGIGDINGDGRGDLVVGIQRQDPGGLTNAGAAMVFSGADGAPIYTFNGQNAGAFFGNEVRGAGDVNNDGVPDIICGAILDDRNGLNSAGSASVFSGADGSLLYLFEGDTQQGLMGRAVDGAGDVNLDGYDDLVVGSTDDDNGLDSGSVMVFSGFDGSILYDIPGESLGDALGASVAGLGDLNGDGYADFAAGARAASYVVAGGGRVYVYSGFDGSILYQYDGLVADGVLHIVNSAGDIDLDGTPDFLVAEPNADTVYVRSGDDGTLIYTFTGNSSGDGFGSRCAGIGDANNDGFNDIIVGAPTDDRNGPAAGAVTVFSGEDGSVLFTLDGDPGDQLGSGVAAAGEVNGDLCDDFMAGAFFDDNSATNSGSVKVFVFSGEACNPDEAPPQVTIDNPSEGQVFGTTSVTLDATVVDESSTDVVSNPAGISDSLPAGGGVVSGTVPLLAEGDNVLVVTATDAAGNVGGTSVTVLRDTIDPAITLVSPPDGSIVASSPVSVTLQIADATATDTSFGANLLSLGRGGGMLVGDVDLVEGPNTIDVTSTDEAGNVGTFSFTLILDTMAPLVTIDDPNDGDCFGPGGTTVGVTATVDDLTATTITTNVNGMATTLPPGGGVLTGTFDLSEGFNQIEVSATDAVGRQGTTQNLVLLDTTAPNVQITSLNENDAVRGVLDLNAIAQDVLPGTDVASVTFEVDTTTISQVITGPYEILFDSTTIADGFHTFRAIAADGKGNIGTDEVTVLVDNTAPALTFDTPFDADVVGGILPIEVSLSDGGSGLIVVDVFAAGGAPTGDPSQVFDPAQPTAFVVGEHDTTLVPDGPMVLQATARDAAGNETFTQIIVTVDNTAPDKTLANPPDGSCVSGTITIEVNADDANLDTIELFAEGTLLGTVNSSPFLVSYDTLQHLDGDITITAVVRDLAGNVASASSTVFVENIDFRFSPTVLDMNGTLENATGVLKGYNLDLVLPTEAHLIQIQVPGGSPVSVDPTWDGDDAIVQGAPPKLNMRFSRSQLRAAIQAGISAGEIRPTQKLVLLKCFVDGRKQGQMRLQLQR